MTVSFIVVVFFAFISLVKATEKLSIYHIQGSDYVKRGEIVGLPLNPVYVPTHHKNVQVAGLGPLYRLKIKDDTSGRVILSNVKFCQLVANDWKDTFRVHLDQGQVYHVDYFTAENSCNGADVPPTVDAFYSTVEMATSQQGPQPILAQSTLKKTHVKEQSANENTKEGTVIEVEEQSFFRKYWQVILSPNIPFIGMNIDTASILHRFVIIGGAIMALSVLTPNEPQK
ncbi:hypothetical protein BDF14DRAFT_1885384 [Spinellus fusiger]|nr:hypothetical protein BDF14DRAFT_1885384 [Spinellus fusiger]